MSTSWGELPPEARRRLQNLAKFWNERVRAHKDDAVMAKVCFDRAKAAARRAQRSGRNPAAMHELAEALATWSAQQEEAEVWHQVRNPA